MFDIFDTIVEDNPKEKKPKEKIKRSKKEDKKSKDENNINVENEINEKNEIIKEKDVETESEIDDMIDEEEIDEQEIEESIEKTKGRKKKEKNENVELTFLENPETGHAIIGRQKSVFKKYGEEGTLYLGKVNEPNYPEKDVYFDSLNPQVVFICGSRGSGKCLTGDAEILTSDGTLKQIKDLKNDCKVLTLNNNFKIATESKKGFYERNVNKILKITLNTGKTITLTPEHPLFTINGWEEAQNLKINSKIATPRILPVFGKKNIPQDKIKLLAYFIAEGHLGNGFTLFANKDKKILSDFNKAIKDFAPNLKLAKEKFIPEEIFKTNKKNIKLFLNRLFSCDGSIYYTNNTWQISYSSSSKKLIEQVQHLLLRFGVVSRFREKNIKYKDKKVISYELTIYGEFVEKYIKEIGFYGDKDKKAKLALKELKNIAYNPNLDTIPKEIFNLIKIENWAKLGKEIGYKCPKSFINSKQYNVSRAKLNKIGKILKNKFIIDLANSDIYWDTIKNIEIIKKKTKVYDISVPKNHNFVANNIIVHNSYMLGVLAEELAIKNKNVGQIVIDPIGVFWSMRYPNKEKREMDLLENFGLNPKGLENVMVFVPEGAAEKIPKETYDSTFTIQPSFLSSDDWALTFSIDRFSPSGLLLEKVIKKVRDGYRTLKGLIFKAKDETYDLNDIIFCLENDAELNSKEKGYRKESIRALVSRFEAAKTWGIFSKRGTPLIELSVPGQLTIIDTSFLEENVSALLVGILARRILNARKMNSRKEATKQMGSDLKIDLENDIPPTWLFLDEAHTLIPSGSLSTPASKAIVEYVKQGRKPGCSLVIATQQPSAIDTRVLSQVGTLATYKLIFDDDIKAVFRRMPSIVPKEYKEPDFIKKLGIGIPIFADRVETTSRAFVLNVRPRMSQHEGREIQTIDTAHNLTEEEALEVMLNVTISKLKQFEELDEHSLKTLLKIMNMKFKKDIKYKEYIAKLLENEIVQDKGKFFIPKDEEDSEYYEEKVTYNVLDIQYSQEEITGSAKRATGWQNFNVNRVYRPIFKVNYRVHNKDGSFASNTCYIDAVKVEFIHYIDDDFAYSEGLSILRTLEADDIRILLALPKKKGFDNEYLKDSFPYGDVKIKNTMDRFISMGILRKEKRGTKNVFFLIKNLELPKNPIHKILSTFEDLDLTPEPVDKENILEARATFETVRNVLGTLWESIKIDEIECVLKQEFLITNLDTKETVLFDAFTGKKII